MEVYKFVFLWGCLRVTFLCLIFHVQTSEILAQTPEIYLFSPEYTLPGKAAQYPGNRVDPPASRFQQFKLKRQTPDFRGNEATEVIDQFIEKPLTFPYALELSILHHFNKPAGIALFLETEKGPRYSFSYFSERDNSPVYLSLYDFEKKKQLAEGSVEHSFQKYWHHVVITVDKGNLAIFYNGELFQQCAFPDEGQEYDLKIAAYLNEEPHSGLGNILHSIGVHRNNVDRGEINQLYQQFKDQIEKGGKYGDLFHFNAGPYLNYPTTNSISLLWETNKRSGATVLYGEKLPLENRLAVPASPSAPPFINEATIEGLAPDSPYFYNIVLKSEDGEEMESGVFTFKTAPEKDQPVLFGVIGDTETRPHINDIVARKLWAERPEFVLMLGDLTDGGMKDAKWQWNLEYFKGMTQLFSRIPVFPVPGNGEGDLFWYKEYHSLPNGEAFYTFKYGNAEFFMLNSNERKEQFASGGTQYQWLDSALAKSTSLWKFVALHHAPYSTDEDDYGDAYMGKSNLGDGHVKALIPLFEKHNVDVVFFGHLHSYNRIGPMRDNSYDSRNGVWYIQAGGAGGNLEDFAPTRAWFSQKNYAGHHYSTVYIQGHEFSLKTYDLEGNLIDFLTIEK